MGLPTDHDRELWTKATQIPGQITDQERRHILQLADPLEQLANALQISGLTPEELERKVLTNTDSLTDPECTLIRHGYHNWDLQERIANSQMDWSTKDKMARLYAVVALRTPHENAVNMAVTRRTVVLADEKDQTRKMTMARIAEELQHPRK